MRKRWDARRRRLTALVADRMQPWVEAGAQRIAGPLARFDPDQRAGEVEARLEVRLESVRSRLEALAEVGRVRRGERTALVTELKAVQGELDRLASRLPAVRVRTVQVRLDAYRSAVEALPEAGRVSRPGQEAGVMAGTAALGWAVLQAGSAPVTAGAGLVAAGGAAAVVTMRSRLRRRERKAALSEAISAAETAVPRLADRPVAELNRELRALVRRARGSGRLSAGASALLTGIAERLEVLLERSLSEDLGQDVVHLVRASITDYLPDTLDPFLAMPDPQARVGDRRAVDEVIDQLAALDRALAAASDRTGRDRAADQLLVQGEFLRTKFAATPHQHPDQHLPRAEQA